ncbi:MAG: hypothetical protein FWG46_05860 [Treponema sp.]|nr:hypothetical protein [Treponema sp.]
MKTKAVLLAILAGMLLLNACVGVKNMGAFDPSIPQDAQCLLEIRNSLGVILFNDQPVDWSPNSSQNRVTIYLPPGNHTFSVRYYKTRSYDTYTETRQITTNIAGTEFAPGGRYRIFRQSMFLSSKVKIKDVTPKEKEPRN